MISYSFASLGIILAITGIVCGIIVGKEPSARKNGYDTVCIVLSVLRFVFSCVGTFAINISWS